MYNKKKIAGLLHKIKELEQTAAAIEQENKSLFQYIHPDHVASARNLLHYLAVRARDIRMLQSDLSEMAISSISHSESSMLSSLRKISYLLSRLSGIEPEVAQIECIDSNESAQLLLRNSEELFGKTEFTGQSKIMVTLPAESAEDYDLVLNMVRTGMDIARINTAHDDKTAWKKMIGYVKKAAKEESRHVKIYMDLEGPKIRTGRIKPVTGKGDSEKIKTPSILLFKGTRLTLTRDDIEGHGGEHPVISLTSPQVFGNVKSGEYVWFDDGKLCGIIASANSKNIVVEITAAPDEGFKLKAEKGINFPDSTLNIDALTDEDLEHLEFIARHADMVGYSFVQKPSDITELQKHLKRLEREDMGIILKIETHLAFDQFPLLLFAAMASRNCGVMIARGDLAVEIGYLRIAEVQEEILWLAEAAHLPVIWATQVLETQIKKGTATRAEISDVVKSVRAECVMLNKGPHVLDAIATIKDIDKRMAAHEDKKRKILRSLHVARAFIEQTTAK